MFGMSEILEVNVKSKRDRRQTFIQVWDDLHLQIVLVRVPPGKFKHLQGAVTLYTIMARSGN